MTRPGSLIAFDPSHRSLLSEQWRSERVEPSLRMTIIVAGMVYHALGAARVSILRLLGNSEIEADNKDSIHYYGRAADISVAELIDSRLERKQEVMERRILKAQHFTDRMNSIFTCQEDVAIYNIDHIHLQVPSGGFRKVDLTLATWMEFGPTGKHISPAIPVVPTDLRY